MLGDPRMSTQQIQQAREKLFAKRRDLAQQVAEEVEQLQTEDPDRDQRASEVVHARIVEKLSRQDREKLARVDAALARIERGTYGICASCGRPIERERLEQSPEADRCGRCG